MDKSAALLGCADDALAWKSFLAGCLTFGTDSGDCCAADVGDAVGAAQCADALNRPQSHVEPGRDAAVSQVFEVCYAAKGVQVGVDKSWQ
ncbi:Uncharacterised protein [Mycobacteroides abscessus]|nr:Uncharacterised protein [Mycobacteroides abscessus]